MIFTFNANAIDYDAQIDRVVNDIFQPQNEMLLSNFDSQEKDLYSSTNRAKLTETILTDDEGKLLYDYSDGS